MKIMACLFINLALLFFACGNVKNDTLPQSIKEIWIYDYFNPGGYTTASAYGQIMRLEKANTPKFKLDQNDTDSLCRMIQKSSTLKLFYEKWACGLIFAEMILKNEQKIKYFLSPVE
jgi:hypothetical protein